MPRETILIVEDDDSIRLSLRDYFKRKGYEVLVASEGLGAIKQLLDHTVDLIITDYRMEVLGGDYWIRFLKRFCGDQAVILTSGFVRSDQSLPYPVVEKPYSYADLEALVEKHLEARGARGS